ncbi:MAG: hypothetical protein AAF281_00395 [Pseudomonadota bacterium]
MDITLSLITTDPPRPGQPDPSRDARVDPGAPFPGPLMARWRVGSARGWTADGPSALGMRATQSFWIQGSPI